MAQKDYREGWMEGWMPSEPPPFRPEPPPRVKSRQRGRPGCYCSSYPGHSFVGVNDMDGASDAPVREQRCEVCPFRLSCKHPDNE